jgi:hypothetical protein
MLAKVLFVNWVIQLEIFIFAFLIYYYLTIRRYILSLLCFIFFVGPFLATGYLIVKKQDLKIHFLERFSNRKTISIEINTNDIVWEDEGKELIINGHLFDIEKITYYNNKAIITGWYDGNEEDINIALDKQHRKHQNQHNIIPLFGYSFCEQISTFKIEMQVPLFSKKYIINNTSFTNFSVEFVSPPPQIA